MGRISEMEHRSSSRANLVLVRCVMSVNSGANGHRDSRGARCRGDRRSPARTTEFESSHRLARPFFSRTHDCLPCRLCTRTGRPPVAPTGGIPCENNFKCGYPVVKPRAIACKPWHPGSSYEFFTWRHIYRAETPVIRVGGPRHPNHLLRANPEHEFGILREFFTCDCLF